MADCDKLLSIQAEFLFTVFNQHNVSQGHIATQFIFIRIISRCMGAPSIPEWLRERDSYPSMHLSTPQPLFTLKKEKEKNIEEKEES